MALRMMSAIVPGAYNASESNPTKNHAADRENLQQDLLAAAKKCHARFGSRTELATESDTCVTHLCFSFEQILDHGLRSNRTEKINSALKHVSDLVSGGTSKLDAAFWPCIKEQLTWHEQERFSVLRRVHTDYGRGRAWLRAALNERSLERHLHAIINPEILAPFYEDWAFLLDQEKSSMLPNVAAGLGTILFAIRIDNEELNDSSTRSDLTHCKISQSEPVISAAFPAPSNSSREKNRKKVPTHIISFDDDDERDKEVADIVSASAPPSCLSSPTVLTKDSSTSSLAKEQTDYDSVNLNEKSDSWNPSEPFEEEKLLTPLTEVGNVGGLVPVSPLESTLDDVIVSAPSYLDDVETAETAIEAMEPLVSLQSDTDIYDVETLRIRLLATTEVLEQAREDAITSRLQLARFQRQHQNYVEKHELQLQALNRENELLRQQLRKYVAAVQMLRRDSDSTAVSEDESALDYHREAQQYQNKLVQVAEMHAELMEFNARLTMQLNSKERLVKLLQAELECLRGPLNDGDLPSDILCLIHIWIPSVFLTGQSSDVHHVYQIYARVRDVEWNIYRRYAQFHSLYRELKKHDSIVQTFEFPPKKTIGNKDAKFVEDRRLKLQQWLRRVVGRLAQCSPTFSLRPSRQTLISLMPFFGDLPSNEQDSRRSNVARNTFSSSPQYTGL